MLGDFSRIQNSWMPHCHVGKRKLAEAIEPMSGELGWTCHGLDWCKRLHAIHKQSRH